MKRKLHRLCAVMLCCTMLAALAIPADAGELSGTDELLHDHGAETLEGEVQSTDPEEEQNGTEVAGPEEKMAGTEDAGPQDEAGTEGVGLAQDKAGTEGAGSGQEEAAPGKELVTDGNGEPSGGAVSFLEIASNGGLMEISADLTRPQITITPAEGGHSGIYYCNTPEISVTDAGENLSSVTVNEEEKGLTGADGALDLGGKVGTIDIVAKDSEGNTSSARIYIGHLPGGRDITDIAPTCTESGWRVTHFICKNCGAEFNGYRSPYGEPTGHRYAEEESQTDGKNVKYSPCANGCGVLVNESNAEYTPENQGHVHQYVEKTVAATCEKAGYTCEVCKCGAIRNKKVINALGHFMGDWIYYVDDEETPFEDIDCSAGTVTRARKCTRCDEKDMLQGYEMTHEWSSVREVIQEATCTAPGKMNYKCVKCGKENTAAKAVEIPALGHDYSGGDGLCTTEKKCARPGCEETLPPMEHSLKVEYDETGHWQVCTNPGCQYTTKENGKAIPHVSDGTAPDCTRPWSCRDCSYTVKAQYESHELQGMDDENYHWNICTHPGCAYTTPKVAHKFTGDDGNCTTPTVCSGCGYKKAPEKSEHDFSGDWVVTVNTHYLVCQNAGCRERDSFGYHEFTSDTGDCTKAVICSVCGYMAMHGPNISHNFKDSAWHGDENGHWQECVNGKCKVKSAIQEHTGGTATCRDLALCTVCGQAYGEKAPENHVGGFEIRDIVEATTEKEGYSGNKYCLGCGEIIEHGEEIPKLEKTHEHTYTVHYDDTKSWEECDECGAKKEGSEKDHVLEQRSDSEGHWQVCQNCHYVTTKSVHAADATQIDTDCTTPVSCKDCGYVLEGAKEHVFDETDWAEDQSGHWHVCTNAGCDQIDAVIPHSGQDDHDCTTPVTCDACGYMMQGASGGHSYSSVWEAENADSHIRRCQNLNCEVVDRQAHEALEDDGLCTTPVICAVCRYELKAGEKEHNFGGEYGHDELIHWQSCQNEGCTERLDGVHFGQEATCESAASCEICGASYGEPDPDNHDGGVEVRGHIDPTFHEEGFSGDTYCLGCGEMIKEGEVLPKREEGVEHLLIWKQDDLHHWQECSICGTREEDSVAEHVLEDAWQYDNTHHWRICQVEECGRVIREGHIYENGKCKVCDFPQPHEHGYQRKSDEFVHWLECPVCGETVEKEAHLWDEGKTVWPDSCTEPGEITYTCSVCGRTRTETLPAAGHSWKDNVCERCGEKLSLEEEEDLNSKQEELEEKLKDETLSQEELQSLEESLAAVQAALNSIAKVKGLSALLSGLPSAQAAQHGDVAKIQGAIAKYRALSASEQGMLSQEEQEQLSELEKALAGLEEAHQYGDGWRADANGHWRECEVCGEKTDAAPHSFQDGKCSVCGMEDPNAVPGTESTPGTEENPGTESTPGTEENPGTESTPGTGENPGTESTPGTEENPGTESTPGTEENPGTESAPGTEENPGTESTPGTEENPGTGSAPGTDESSDTESGGSEQAPEASSDGETAYVSPKTGDDSRMELWVLLMGLSGVLLIAYAYRAGRRRRI